LTYAAGVQTSQINSRQTSSRKVEETSIEDVWKKVTSVTH